ncbi:hypothetical protein M422DRAFT_242303 [Sphaerobolus stellatus SS14]|nr:hypothetical protein M422DRAFT_242303 [Sphaerobolus stellatus SS14]
MALLPLVSISLATLIVDSLLYGIFLLLTIASLYFLIVREDQKNIAWKYIVFRPLILANICMYGLVTGHWVVVVFRAWQAFIINNEGRTPLEFYSNFGGVTDVVKAGFLVATLLCGDMMMAYRLWIIWDYRKLVVVFPCCLMIALFACGIGITVQLANYQPQQSIFLSLSGRWITSNTVFTLCTNLYGTSLIAWRVWRITDQAQCIQVSGRSVSVPVILVESAAIYTTWTAIFFIVYQAQSTIQLFFIDTWPVVTGITFMLINVQVGVRSVANSWKSTSRTHTLPTRAIRNEISGNKYDKGERYQMRPLAVNISQIVETESDGQHYSVGDDNDIGSSKLPHPI